MGIVAYYQLPVSALPQVDYPTIQVADVLSGRQPGRDGSRSRRRLERQFGQVPGLNQMTSTSSEGSSVITLQFILDPNIDVAEQQVQAAINAAGTFLPTDLPIPPIYSKINPADPPILTLALTRDTLPLSKVEDFADTRLAQKISQLPGVGLVTHQRRPEAGDPRAGQSDRAVGPAASAWRMLRTAHRDSQRQPGQGKLRRPAPVLHDRRQRPVAHRRAVPATLIIAYQQRRAGAI